MVSNETLNNVKSRHAPMIAKRNKQLLAIVRPGIMYLVILNASNGDNSKNQSVMAGSYHGVASWIEG
jgi:hypothetical protein